jgi:hypothetical protein
MDHLDDLPKRHKNHVTESKAEAAFQNLLSNSEDFVLQGSDHNDYGTTVRSRLSIVKARPTSAFMSS